MASELPGVGILDQYRNISNKLKKRFLRKPNVTEACESFASLGQQCEATELPAYAGLCWIAAARCEGSLLNIPGEVSCLIRAGRQFLQAEKNDQVIGCPSPSTENLQAALSCFTYTSTRCPEGSPTPISLNLEMVDFLKRLDLQGCIEDHLNQAIEQCDGNLDTKIHCLEMQASNYIQSQDYTLALNTFTEIVSIVNKLPVNGSRSGILLKCETNRLLLLLILRPAPQKLSPSLGKLLEKYMWGEENEKTLKACGMTKKMFILLQSLVAVCQSFDTTNLVDLEAELWPLLENEERDLLKILVRIYQ